MNSNGGSGNAEPTHRTPGMTVLTPMRHTTRARELLPPPPIKPFVAEQAVLSPCMNQKSKTEGVVRRGHNPINSRGSQLMDPHIRANLLGDAAQMIVMRQVNDLPDLRHLRQQAEGLFCPEIVKCLHDVVGNERNC